MKSNVQKLSVLPWLNFQRGKEDQAAIYIRITIEGKRAEIATNFNATRENWNNQKRRLKDRADDSQEINRYIDDTISGIGKKFAEFVKSGTSITSDELKMRYLGTYEEQREKTILDAFNFHNEQLQELVRAEKRSLKTMDHFIRSRKKLIAFMKTKRRVQDLPISEIRMPFAIEYIHYLVTIDGLSENSANSEIKRLKKVMGLAVSMEWTTTNAISDFKCKYVQPERIILTDEEIDRLWNLEIDIPRLEEDRDSFIFSCYTGFAYAETKSLEHNAAFLGIDGDLWISTNRQKTDTREGVPLLPIPMQIVQKYQNNPVCIAKNKLLPVKTNATYNKNLKILAKMAGINKNLFTHLARHTFATTVTLANGVPIETVSKMLGHKQLSTTQIYAKVIDLKVSADMKALRSKLHPVDNNKKQIA